MKLFDLHCDTFYDIHAKNLSLAKNDLHVDLEKLSGYEASVQAAAIWASQKKGNEATWEFFLAACATMDEQIALCPRAVRVTDADSIRRAVEEGKNAFILAVEDARMLNGYLSRVDIMHKMGVRFMTLQWGGPTIIGGAHDTDLPLTDFGRAVVRRCFEVGIIPDVSHASRAVTAEVLEMAKAAGKTVVATHSNSFGVFNHTRNLTDEEFKGIVALGGLAGISMVPYHLTDHDNGAPCNLQTLADHILHYISLGGENTVCMGGDFDGVGVLPEGIENISSQPRLADYLRAGGMSEEQIEKIFFRNAYDFAMRNL
ncbi:MAG: hypothetical protein E7662_06975 [Ruminococcaceae bacterium]|nr:hypothetical protein [Oscillospiraceae bacterium]